MFPISGTRRNCLFGLRLLDGGIVLQGKEGNSITAGLLEYPLHRFPQYNFSSMTLGLHTVGPTGCCGVAYQGRDHDGSGRS